MSVIILLTKPGSQECEVTVGGLIQLMERVITRFIDIKPVSRKTPLGRGGAVHSRTLCADESSVEERAKRWTPNGASRHLLVLLASVEPVYDDQEESALCQRSIGHNALRSKASRER